MSQYPDTYGTVKLSKLKKAIQSIEEHYKDQSDRIEDIEISFEFIIGSFFSEVLNNIRTSLQDEHTKGYIEGNNDRLGFTNEKIKMQGLYDDVVKVYNNLLDCKKILENGSRGLDDAPYHGWNGEVLKEQKHINEVLYKEITSLLGICSMVLSYEE